jgi:hypothetical protein
MTTLKAQYLGTCLKKEVESLIRVAQQLQTGEMAAEGLPLILREVEKQFKQLSKTAELRSL